MVVKIFQIFNTVILVVIFLSGIFVWIDAQKRGYNKIFWSLITILFFPLGLIAYIVFILRKPT